MLLLKSNHNICSHRSLVKSDVNKSLMEALLNEGFWAKKWRAYEQKSEFPTLVGKYIDSCFFYRILNWISLKLTLKTFQPLVQTFQPLVQTFQPLVQTLHLMAAFLFTGKYSRIIIECFDCHRKIFSQLFFIDSLSINFTKQQMFLLEVASSFLKFISKSGLKKLALYMNQGVDKQMS